MKRWAALVIKLAITGAALAILLRAIDARAVWAEVRTADPGYLGIAAIFFIAQLAVQAWRLRIISRVDGNPASSWTVTRATVLAHSANQVLPSVVGGDAVRVLTLCRAGLSLMAALRQIALDRTIGVVALVLMVLAAAPPALRSLPDAPATATWLVVAGFTAVIILVVAGSYLVTRRPLWMRNGRFSRLVEVGGLVWEGLAKLWPDKIAVIVTLALSIACYVFYSFYFWAIARSLDLDISIPYVLFVVPNAVIVMMAPITVSGWGLREAMLIGALGMVGIGAEQAVAASMLFGAMALAFGVVGLLFFLGPDRHGRQGADAEPGMSAS